MKAPPDGNSIRFRDRRDAGRQLAALLGGLREQRPLVVGVPRGGVPVAAEVARALGAPLEIIVVRKIGAPQNPEFGIGAVAEDGVSVIDDRAVRELGLGEEELAELVARGRAELLDRQRRYRAGAPPLPVRDRTVVLVDDGLATGRSAQAAARSLRERGARRVILAVPVAAPASKQAMLAYVDEVVCVEAPAEMWAIGLWYEDFSPPSDADIEELMHGRHGASPDRRTSRAVQIDDPAGVSLRGRLGMPAGAQAAGVIAFAHGSGSSAASPRNRAVAARLESAGFATLLFDLLTPQEARERANVFDVDLLALRLLAATAWVRRQPDISELALGYFGASTGTAAALIAAAQLGGALRAVVSRGGRPDLARGRLHEVLAPVLLIVGEADPAVLECNRAAQEQLAASELAIVAGASHLFEQPGAIDEVARLATDWFTVHLRNGDGARDVPAA